MKYQHFFHLLLGLVVILSLLEITFVKLRSSDLVTVSHDGFHSDTIIQQRLFDVLNRTTNHTGELIRPRQSIPTYDSLYFKHSSIPRLLSLKKFNLSITLLEAVTALLTENNISFIMAQGTLLGSYFFHSLVPWDDDMDLFVDILHINKLRSVFRTKRFRQTFEVTSFHEPRGVDMWGSNLINEDIPLNNTHSCGQRNPKKTCYQQLKIYFRNSPHAGKYKWGYPFVDIFFTYRNGSFVINHEHHGPIKVIKVAEKDFYPTVLRPLHHLWLPAPHNTKAFLKVDYKKFVCKRSIWNHQEEKVFKGVVKSPCDKLTGHYPYVRRRPYISPQGTKLTGQVLEDLMLNDKVIHTVLVNQTYYTADVLRLE